MIIRPFNIGPFNIGPFNIGPYDNWTIWKLDLLKPLQSKAYEWL